MDSAAFKEIRNLANSETIQGAKIITICNHHINNK